MACSCTFAIVTIMIVLAWLLIGSVTWWPWIDFNSAVATVHRGLIWSCTIYSTSIGHSAKCEGISEAYEKFTLAAICLTGICLFVGMCATCGICCNCCRNPAPAWVVTIASSVGLGLTLLGIIVYGAKKPSGSDLSIGFFLAMFLLVMLLAIVILSWVCMIKQKDLVQYEPKVIGVAYPPAYPGGVATTYPPASGYGYE